MAEIIVGVWAFVVAPAAVVAVLAVAVRRGARPVLSVAEHNEREMRKVRRRAELPVASVVRSSAVAELGGIYVASR